jgi:hypothetical protein
MPSPHVYAKLPKVQYRRWKKYIVSQRKKTATQSLKHRKMKTLWSRLERMRRVKM